MAALTTIVVTITVVNVAEWTMRAAQLPFVACVVTERDSDSPCGHGCSEHAQLAR